METLKDVCDPIRLELETMKQAVLSLKNSSCNSRTSAEKGEVIANIMLAYRHLEDARMRLGKTIQADGDGVSIYDKQESKKS